MTQHTWTFWSNRKLSDCCDNGVHSKFNPVHVRLCPPERHAECGKRKGCMRETPGCAWDTYYLAKQLIPAYKRRAGKRPFSIPLRANEQAKIDKYLQAQYAACREVRTTLSETAKRCYCKRGYYGMEI